MSQHVASAESLRLRSLVATMVLKSISRLTSFQSGLGRHSKTSGQVLTGALNEQPEGAGAFPQLQGHAMQTRRCFVFVVHLVQLL